MNGPLLHGHLLPAAQTVQPNKTKWTRCRSVVLSVLLGQLLSICLCVMGVCSQYIEQEIGINTCIAQIFVVYLLLALTYVLPLACRTVDGLVPALRQRGWKYALLAVVDVQANYLAVRAYQYTNLTSIQLLDCFTIPCVLGLTFVFLRTRYSLAHIIGVSACLLGVGCVVWADTLHGTAESRTRYPRPWLGDVLCLLAAALYAVSNVAEEGVVKAHSRIEYLGMLGLFGSIVAGIQLIILERDEVGKIPWSRFDIALSYAGFVVGLYVFYSLVAFVIQRTSAAFFNLSILTADFFSLLAGILLFHFKFHLLYLASFTLVIIGTIVYSSRPTRQAEPSSETQALTRNMPRSPLLGPSLLDTTPDVMFNSTPELIVEESDTNYGRRHSIGQVWQKQEGRRRIENVRIVRYCAKHGTVVMNDKGERIE